MLSVHLQNAYPKGIPKKMRVKRFSRLIELIVTLLVINRGRDIIKLFPSKSFTVLGG